MTLKPGEPVRRRTLIVRGQLNPRATDTVDVAQSWKNATFEGYDQNGKIIIKYPDGTLEVLNSTQDLL